MTQTQKLKAIAAVFEDYLAEQRALNDLINEDLTYKMSDPMADVRINIHDNRVEVTFDGAGYDQLSCESTVADPFSGRIHYVGDETQEKLTKELRKIDPDLYIENINSWSFGVWL
jgi:hypothetical protein